jgi:hypothetical protein
MFAEEIAIRSSAAGALRWEDLMIEPHAQQAIHLSNGLAPLAGSLGPEQALAVALIGLFAWFRFATPPGVRADTTWIKFLLGRLAYLGLNLALFLVLIATPSILRTVLRWTGFTGEWLNRLPEAWGSSSTWLLSALALTVFLSEIPVLTRLDRALRDYFHRVAAIPRERRCWMGLLERSRVKDDEAVRARIAQRFERSESGLRADHVCFEADGSPRALWTRISVLFDRLEELATSRRYADCLRCPEFETLRELYATYEKKAGACFELSRTHPGDEAVKLLQQEFAEQAENLLAGLHHLASGLILRCGRTEGQRLECVESLGLEPAPFRMRRPDVHGALWTVLILLGFLAPTLERLGAAMVLLITLNCAGAALAAVLAKHGRDFYFPRRIVSSVPPVGYYLVAGAAGMSLALANSWVVHSLFPDLRPGPALDQILSVSWKWALIPLTVAAGIAALTDDWFDHHWPALHRRLDLLGVFNPLDGIVLALMLAAVTVFVVFPLVAAQRPTIERIWTVGRMVGIGFILGSLVPALYRNAERQSEAAESELPISSLRPAMIVRLGG